MQLLATANPSELAHNNQCLLPNHAAAGLRRTLRMSLQISCTSTSLSAALAWMSLTRANRSPIWLVATLRSCLQEAVVGTAVFAGTACAVGITVCFLCLYV